MDRIFNNTIQRMGLKHIHRPTVFDDWPGVVAAMSLRASGEPGAYNMSFTSGDATEAVAHNRTHLTALLGFSADDLVTQRQVHGCEVAHVTRAHAGGDSDALLTSDTGILLAVSVADCVPVLLFDPETGVVGGIHSGWRGTVADVVASTFRCLRDDLGVVPSRVLCFVGASAGVCCYEVGEDVAMMFPAQRRHQLSSGTWLLDNRGTVVDQLLEQGVAASHIEIDMRCSICDTTFHSHRRDRMRSGRMLAVIGRRN